MAGVVARALGRPAIDQIDQIDELGALPLAFDKRTDGTRRSGFTYRNAAAVSLARKNKKMTLPCSFTAYMVLTHVSMCRNTSCSIGALVCTSFAHLHVQPPHNYRDITHAGRYIESM
jgi:hypothetical protein